MGDFGENLEDKIHTRNLVLSVFDLKPKGDLPAARVGGRIVTVGPKIYLHGGADQHRTYGDLYELTAANATWKLLSVNGFAKPTPRYGHSLIAIGPKLLLFGGMAADNDTELIMDESVLSNFKAPAFMGRNAPEWHHQPKPSDDLFLFDTNTLTWSRPAADSAEPDGSFPRPRGWHAAVVAHNKLVVYGGAVEANFRPTDELWILDNVQSIAPGAQTKTGGGDLLDMDGAGDVSTSSGVLVWHKIKLPEGSVHPGLRVACQACVTSSGRLILFGGRGDDTAVWELKGIDGPLRRDPSTGVYTNIHWVKIQVQHTAPLPRAFHTVNAIGGKVYVFAGITPVETSDLYVLDEAEMRWRKPLFEGTINVRGQGAAVINDKLIVFGGARDRPSATAQSAGGAGTATGAGGPTDGPRGKDIDPLAEDAWNRLSRKLLFLSVLQIKPDAAQDAAGNELKFKLITVGDSGVGKSCLLTRFVVDTFRDAHQATLGLDYKIVSTLVKGKLVKLQLWDTAGQERFGTVTSQYFRGAHGFLFVYDCGRRETFEHIQNWMNMVAESAGKDLLDNGVKLIVSNKHDLPASQIQVSEEEGKAFAESVGGVFVAASAKTSQNVDLAFLQVASRLAEEARLAKHTSISSSGTAGSALRLGGGLRLSDAPRRNMGQEGGCGGGGCAGSGLNADSGAGLGGFLGRVNILSGNSGDNSNPNGST